MASMNGVRDTSWSVGTGDLGDLRGKRVAIVGGTDGIGRALARAAAAHGATVVVVGRTFRDEGTPGISFLRADLSSMHEARRVGRALDAALDVVVLTTGIFAAPRRETTAEGIERDYAVSTLSRWAILKELAPRLPPRARVFVMGFPGAGNLGDPDDLDAAGNYDAFKVHMNTVAGNEAMVLDAKQRWPHVDVFGLNPGLIKSNIRGNTLGEGSLKQKLVEGLIGIVMPSADQYAARVLPLFVAPSLAGRSGALFGKKGAPILPSEGFDTARAAAFVRASDALLARVGAA